jgi:hypothetical protein
MIPVYDLKIERDWIGEDIIHGIEGRWRFRQTSDLALHTHDMDGWQGFGWETERGRMRFLPVFRWNGSNVVRDTIMCLGPSAFHDAACEYIDDHYGGWHRYRVRWMVDRLYGQYCRWQGMSWARAKGRAFGLHARATVWPFKRLPILGESI